MIYGYARVSTVDQDPSLQVAALEARGCERVVLDRASGGTRNRPGLEQLLSDLVEGDVVVVWKLDRLGRSVVDLLWILDRMTKAGAGFLSVTEAIDTTTAAGRMQMQLLAVFAEFEREMIRERTQAGLDAARERGVRLGRRLAITKAQHTEIIKMLTDGRTQKAVAELFGVSQSTISRAWKQRAILHEVSESPDPTLLRHAPETGTPIQKRAFLNEGEQG